MPFNPLVKSLPDLVVLMLRDGRVIAHEGGQSVPELRPLGRCAEEGIRVSWSESTAALIKQLTRTAIASRTAAQSEFQERGRKYEVRVTPQSPDRVICVVRLALPGLDEVPLESPQDGLRPMLEKKAFLRRFEESIANASLREKSLALAVLYIDGIVDLSRIFAAGIAEQILSAALVRVSEEPNIPVGTQPHCYLGPLAENVVALVVETSDRDVIEKYVSEVCKTLREPVTVGDAEFQLTPYAGVAVLRPGASSPKVLLDYARAAAAEARRAASNDVIFSSETMKRHSLACLDLARELREAITNGSINLRYIRRHELSTGRMITLTGYARWMHALRGDIRPAEFLSIAERTGLATTLSRRLLACLRQDFAPLIAQAPPETCVSFGPLQEHVLQEGFIGEIEAFLASGVPAERFELRIGEKTFMAREPAPFKALQKHGVRIVVDEVGRDMVSLPWLARAPVWGLQLDRAWVTTLHNDEVAAKVCRAGISAALSLGLTPLATGVDSSRQRDALLTMGCQYGSGDLFGATCTAVPQVSEIHHFGKPPRRAR